jgi:hypothetical protein
MIILFFQSFAKETMLNINAFFEFKQRTRYTHSFQLAQLIYHAQHLNDYYSSPQNIGTDTNRRISLPPSDESVSDLLRIESEGKTSGNFFLV